MDKCKMKNIDPVFPNVETAAGNGNITEPSIQLQDLDIAVTKGRPSKLKSNKRTMPKAEEMRKKQKQKYACKKCDRSGHNIATCTVEFTMTGTQQDTTEEGKLRMQSTKNNSKRRKI